MSEISEFRILVIEDDPAIGMLIEDALGRLRKKFNSVTITRSDLLHKGRILVQSSPSYDLVVLDLRLPDSEIEQTIGQIDLMENYSPVIIVTGYPETMIRKLLDNREIDVIYKGGKGLLWLEVLCAAIVGAIIRWRQRNHDRIEANIRRIKELAHETPTGTQDTGDASNTKGSDSADSNRRNTG